MLANLTGWHLLIVLAVVLLLFGAARLPQLARSAGQSVRIIRAERTAFRDEFDAAAQEDGDGSAPAAPARSTSPGS
jgi:sec-independent protein translocase protein TatA